MEKTKIVIRGYEEGDFEKMERFYKENYEKNGFGYSWNIDRYNFTYTVSRSAHGVSIKEWQDKHMIVEENGQIIAIVNTEAEKHGEAFIQIDRMNYDQPLIKEMFDYVEQVLRHTENGETYVMLRIKQDNKAFKEEAIKRGFMQEDWSEVNTYINLEDKEFQVKLPEGFTIKSGRETTGRDRMLAHSKAFNYSSYTEDAENLAKGFEEMMKLKSYLPDLDISVMNPEGTVAAFATVWYDDLNKIAILEPVGTDPAYQRKGLAKAAIYEGINRVRELGATRIYVGNDLPFYIAIGFQYIDQQDVYKKVFDTTKND